MARVAVVGGGPGGLMTTYMLTNGPSVDCDVTLFEVADRVGGKLDTRTFDRAPVRYEAGIAECYDYSDLGPDPLREFVSMLGLETVPLSGETLFYEDRRLRNDDDIRTNLGAPTLAAIREFRERLRNLMPADRWHPGHWRADHSHPFAGTPCSELLDTVVDPTARRYLEIASHSDLATEPYLTDALNGIMNFVLDIPGYVKFYTIKDGMTALAESIGQRIPDATIRCGTRVTMIDRRPDGSWSVHCLRKGRTEEHVFDAVILALPVCQLHSLRYAGPVRAPMGVHVARYDQPGHYLRVSLLFESRFWQRQVSGSWFMVDDFGGACVYDESSRFDADGYGALGFLIAGQDALAAANLDDGKLSRRVIEGLPVFMRQTAARRLLEARVHRWCGGVSAQPGGLPLRDPLMAHQPDPHGLPGLFVVGGYLFDSTLNGVHASARCATGLLTERLQARKRRFTRPVRLTPRCEEAVPR